MARETIGTSFDPRRNSLNFLRLALATCVIVSHSQALPGSSEEVIFRHTGLGTLGVYGFFGISGYLIAGSASRNNFGRYLWQRFLRIAPAFWVCLIVVAFVFSPRVHVSPTLHPVQYRNQTPLSYVESNWLLQIDQFRIRGVPWNASIWTIYYEFLCYLLLGALALVGVLRRPLLLLAIAVTAWSVLAFVSLDSSVGQSFNSFENTTWIPILQLTVIFLVGSVIFAYRDHLPDSWPLALVCSVGFMASLWMPNHGTYVAFGFSPQDLFAFLIAYPMIWLGIHLPFHKVGVPNDYSYGIYIYAFPVQILLAYWGVQSWGKAPYLAMIILCTIPLAAASWWGIEKHALKAKNVDFIGLADRIVGAPKKEHEPKS